MTGAGREPARAPAHRLRAARRPTRTSCATWGAALHRVDGRRGRRRFPTGAAFDGIIAMGGPMGAYEDDRLPWLSRGEAADRRRGVGRARRSGACASEPSCWRPASAPVRCAGAEPPRSACSRCRRTDAEAPTDPVFESAAGRSSITLQWHVGHVRRCPRAPSGSRAPDAYEQQAFVFERAYGVQFHIEVGDGAARPSGARSPRYADSLGGAHGRTRTSPVCIDADRALTRARRPSLARRLFAAWLERVVDGPRHPEPPAPGQRHSPPPAPDQRHSPTPAPNPTAASTSSALL